MMRGQEVVSRGTPPFELASERLGPLPLVNHFIEQLRLPRLLDRYVPTTDRRCRLAYGKALGVLLRSIVVEREPLYRHEALVESFAPTLFGVEPCEARRLCDDTLGRALDQLFLADRAGLLTDVVVAVSQHFAVRLEELHNDSTTIQFAGQYRAARGRWRWGKWAPCITYGFSKDHRPDLKQLLFILTTSADGGVPVQFRCADGNTNDSVTHIQTWEALRQAAGRADFLYVADSKLCSYENMGHIDGARAVVALPSCRVRARKTNGSAAGSRHTPCRGKKFGTGRIRGASTAPVIGGMCIAANSPRRKAGRSSGSTARCSPSLRSNGGWNICIRPQKSWRIWIAGFKGLVRAGACVTSWPSRSSKSSNG